MAVLSSTFNYAVKRVRWISENPCLNLLRLKDTAVRDRVVQKEEISKIIDACKKSKSPYLYCIVLFAITTGARQGELLELDRSGIHVAEYLTALPSKKILHEKLHKATAHARQRLGNQQGIME